MAYLSIIRPRSNGKPLCAIVDGSISRPGQPIDCKRDQFRKYIESKGVIEMFTKVLVKLLETPVKPEHPIDFIRDNLGATVLERSQIDQLERKVSDYEKEIGGLKREIAELQVKLKEQAAEVASATEEAVTEPPEEAASSEPKEGAAAPVPASGGAKVDDSSDKRINESEKAAAPSSNAVDNGPVIEAATANSASAVPESIADDKDNAKTDESEKEGNDDKADAPSTAADDKKSTDATKADENDAKTTATAPAAAAADNQK